MSLLGSVLASSVSQMPICKLRSTVRTAWEEAPKVCSSENSPSCFSFQMAGLASPIKNKENFREMKGRKRKIYRAAIREETAKIGS